MTHKLHEGALCLQGLDAAANKCNNLENISVNSITPFSCFYIMDVMLCLNCIGLFIPLTDDHCCDHQHAGLYHAQPLTKHYIVMCMCTTSI